MPQRHSKQHGTFHVTTNTLGRIPWCTWPGIPEILMDNLIMSRNIEGAQVFAFCILPDHMHLILNPGIKGLSAFMHSFKRNSSWHVRQCLFAIPVIPAAEVHEPRLRNIKTANFGIPSAEKIGMYEPRLRSRKMQSLIVESDDIQWQKSFHDERIRDATQRSNALTYVQYNAWRHGLVADPEGWEWSSLRFPDLIDPTEAWLD